MFAGLKKFALDLFTEDDDNSVFCPVRVFGAGLISTHIGATIVQVAQHGTFDAMAFGTGAAALITAVGAAVGIKAKLGG